MKDARERCRR